ARAAAVSRACKTGRLSPRDGTRHTTSGALCYAQVAAADLCVATRARTAAGAESDFRCQALAVAGSGAVLAGARPEANRLARAVADHRLLLLRRERRECGASAGAGGISESGRASGGVHAGIGGSAGGRPVL